MGLPFQSNCGVEDRDGPWHFNQYSGIRSMLFESGTAVKTIVASSITQAPSCVEKKLFFPEGLYDKIRL